MLALDAIERRGECCCLVFYFLLLSRHPPPRQLDVCLYFGSSQKLLCRTDLQGWPVTGEFLLRCGKVVIGESEVILRVVELPREVFALGGQYLLLVHAYLLPSAIVPPPSAQCHPRLN